MHATNAPVRWFDLEPAMNRSGFILDECSTLVLDQRLALLGAAQGALPERLQHEHVNGYKVVANSVASLGKTQVYCMPGHASSCHFWRLRSVKHPRRWHDH